MDLDKRLLELKKVINSDLLVDIYGAKWRRRWYKMFSHFIKLIDEERIELGEDDIRNIKDYIENTKSIILFKPLDDDSRYMLRKLLEFLYNINENSALKDNEIRTDILLCVKMLDMCMTLNELIGVSREIINKLNEIVSYSPPAFKLAEHYLNTLLEEIEKDNNE